MSTTTDPVATIADLALTIRKAISASLPTARDQFMTISMPGRILNIEPGAEFVPALKFNSFADNKRKVNEARLVDSMIPLSSVMLGTSGKSVARSYLTALDHLVPANASLDLDHLEENSSTAPKGKYSGSAKYNSAMDYLLRPPPKKEPGQTIVDIYIQKQRAYSDAQIELEGVLGQNTDTGHKGKGAALSAEALAVATSQMKRANDRLQAAWMDWVINGQKMMIDHHFAIVDTTTIMGRIENAKAAVRRATISDVEDGTEWARVTLSPDNWATLCAEKANGWVAKNPLSPAVIQMEITRLKQMVIALTGNLQWARANVNKPAEVPDDGAVVSEALTAKLTNWELKKVAVNNAAAGAAKVDAEREAEAAGNDYNKLKVEEMKQAKQQKATNEINAYSELVESVKDCEKAPKDEQNKSMDKVKSQAQAVQKLLDAKKRQQGALVSEIVSGSSKDLANSLELKIKEIEAEIALLTQSLKNAPKSSGSRLKVITDVRSVKTGGDAEYLPVQGEAGMSESIRNALAPPTAAEQPPKDPWTTITFHSSRVRATSNSWDKTTAVHAEVEANYGLFAAAAKTDIASAGQALTKTMEESSITGTFSCMLVQINRPWLHGELFLDTDVDTPVTSKLSPGSKQLKQWLNGQGDGDLASYGSFPWYPTAFVVAADTELEIKCTRSDAEVMASSMSTNTSAHASYGPFVSGSGTGKTDEKAVGHRSEVTENGMKISFQAPQIIGWVSEILPELPRAGGVGGLSGAPVSYNKR